MKKTLPIIIGIVLIVVIGFFAFSGNNRLTQETSDVIPSGTNSIADDQIVEENDGETLTPGSYEVYSPEKITDSKTDNVVLFFHASWCPSCRGLNSDIEKKLTTIPEELTILKVDYDKETELKTKYGVTTQHTLVQVDKEGNLIKKWSGGSSLEKLVSQIE